MLNQLSDGVTRTRPERSHPARNPPIRRIGRDGEEALRVHNTSSMILSARYRAVERGKAIPRAAAGDAYKRKLTDIRRDTRRRFIPVISSREIDTVAPPKLIKLCYQRKYLHRLPSLLPSLHPTATFPSDSGIRPTTAAAAAA